MLENTFEVPNVVGSKAASWAAKGVLAPSYFHIARPTALLFRLKVVGSE